MARRVDEARGFWEEATFLPLEHGSLFSVTYAPIVPARSGVVICCSIMVEQLTTYRDEVLLARSLAARGVAVQRFHYRGTGNSGGSEGEMSLRAMVEDTLQVARTLQDRTNPATLAFFGTRWGALVAGLAARQYPASPLALLEPVVDASQYFRELIRSRLVREVVDDRFAGARGEQLMKEFERAGQLDILGFTLSKTLYDSAQGTRLDAALTGRTAPVLLVQFSRHNALRQEYVRLKEGMEAPEVFTAHVIREEPAWFWPSYRVKAAKTLITYTTNWLAGAGESRIGP